MCDFSDSIIQATSDIDEYMMNRETRNRKQDKDIKHYESTDSN